MTPFELDTFWAAQKLNLTQLGHKFSSFSENFVQTGLKLTSLECSSQSYYFPAKQTKPKTFELRLKFIYKIDLN